MWGEAAQVLHGQCLMFRRRWAGVWGGERVGAVVVLGGRPGDDVGAVVRARASVLAEVDLERLNLQQTVGDEARKEGRGRG